MEWRRYPYVEHEAAALRKFGTEISSNILNKEKHNKPRAIAPQNRKRKFGELNEDQKEEERNASEFGNAAKRTRYNLRSRKVEFVEVPQPQRTESTASVSVEDLGKGNNHGAAAKLSNNHHNHNMETDGNSSDEDIDLIEFKKQQQAAAQAVSRGAGEPNKIIIPLRRSLRLRNKRARKLQEGTKAEPLALQCGDNKMVPVAATKKAVDMEDEQSAEAQYILEPVLMQCDAEHLEDDLWVGEYASEITEWYVACEEEQRRTALIRSNYISSSFQRDLNSSMRLILLDWLLNVHRRFKLNNTTFFLAIYILDAYLSVTAIKRGALQMVGCCAMWIASKYHEIYAPESNDFVYIADRSFDIQTLFDTEIDILTKLKFRFASIITPLHFIERYLQIVTFPLSKKYQSRNTAKARRDGEKYIFLVKDISLYFAELSLFDCKLVSNEKPSKLAAAAICFAILSISLYPKWPDFMRIATKYEYQDLRPVMLRLNEIRSLTQQNQKLMAVRKKHLAHQEWIDKLNISLAINNRST
eukprot:CAMPEP_0202688508 /NCGR_PEP_ID=MMETSP1385-20130828/4009_1 /ASSEMBLY_ACC=CAM_ASM_000861 /TAXON_ID=933848 /ORGANISM="Elphidium margaritaceum" /LENGTH=527 /DNA_ID=CAMNT_0049343501 /DNA_START=84 /DNA_END=1667 /DNA_ORIENTATION=+